LADTPESGAKVALLVRSLRDFGGAASDSDVRTFVPTGSKGPSAAQERLLVEWGVELVSIDLDSETMRFPFAAKVHSAAAAEADLVSGGPSDSQGGTLVWMDCDTLVLREPGELCLADGECLAYRPVHHQLIGSSFEEPLDEYWSLVYESCDVDEGAAFEMTTCADRRAIRPYYNAGLLAVDPGAGILSRWQSTFDAHHRRPELLGFYERDAIYAIFVHQALLSGVILANVERSASRELPEWYNYPLHLHKDYDAARRPKALDELITCRYERLPHEQEATWWSGIEIGEPLADWLQRHSQRLIEADVH
jgi:hypothetical protein